MKSMLYAAILLMVAATVGFSLWARLAPSDPALWNAALDDTAPLGTGPCAQQVKIVPLGASASCLVTGDPAALLAKLGDIALASPRTTLLAGTPAEGRMTWIARSKLMGYPDYITAQVKTLPEGTRLDISSRQRFGQKDLGVNEARLQSWLSGL